MEEEEVGTLEALQEFERLCCRYGKCLMFPLRYVTPRDKKRKALCEVVNKLSDGVFSLCLPYIISTINMKKDICEEYGDSESQVDGILEWLPRMKEYRVLLLVEVKGHREKYKLKV